MNRFASAYEVFLRVFRFFLLGGSIILCFNSPFLRGKSALLSGPDDGTGKPASTNGIMGADVENGPTIYSVQLRPSTPNFQLFLNLNDNSTIVTPNAPLYQLTGGIYAGAFLKGVFYGIELENNTFVDYLVTIPHEGNALGVRVNPGTPVGFPNVEGLAAVDGKLIGASVNFSGHQTTLIEINPETGAGTAIGNSSTDVMLVGLTYDPVGKVLYGAGIPFATVNGHNLFTIDPLSGATTLIGPLGTEIQGLAWNHTLGLIGTFDHLYTINAQTGAATQVGTTDFTDGKGKGPGIFNGLYAAAALVPTGEIRGHVLDIDKWPLFAFSFLQVKKRVNKKRVNVHISYLASSLYPIEHTRRKYYPCRSVLNLFRLFVKSSLVFLRRFYFDHIVGY